MSFWKDVAILIVITFLLICSSEITPEERCEKCTQDIDSNLQYGLPLEGVNIFVHHMELCEECRIYEMPNLTRNGPSCYTPAKGNEPYHQNVSILVTQMLLRCYCDMDFNPDIFIEKMQEELQRPVKADVCLHKETKDHLTSLKKNISEQYKKCIYSLSEDKLNALEGDDLVKFETTVTDVIVNFHIGSQNDPKEITSFEVVDTGKIIKRECDADKDDICNCFKQTAFFDYMVLYYLSVQLACNNEESVEEEGRKFSESFNCHESSKDWEK